MCKSGLAKLPKTEHMRCSLVRVTFHTVPASQSVVKLLEQVAVLLCCDGHRCIPSQSVRVSLEALRICSSRLGPVPRCLRVSPIQGPRS